MTLANPLAKMTETSAQSEMHRALAQASRGYWDRRKAKKFCIGFLIFSVLFLIIGVSSAAYIRDAHALNRAGGLLTALSLLVIIYQFRFEQRRKHDEENLHKLARKIAEDRPYDTKFLEDIKLSLKNKVKELEDVRYFILLTSVSVGFFGEITHACGDLLLHWVMPNAFNKGH